MPYHMRLCVENVPAHTWTFEMTTLLTQRGPPPCLLRGVTCDVIDDNYSHNEGRRHACSVARCG